MINKFRKFLTCLIGLLIILFVSCKDDKEEVNRRAAKIKSVRVDSRKSIRYKIDFPDTVYINDLNSGTIKYESPLDSIITTFGNPEKNRYTRFILRTGDNVNYDKIALKKAVKDTFGALNNRTIPFYDIKFPKRGTYYIDGIINDIVLINLHTKDKEGENLSRIVEYDERVTKRVIVLEKNRIKN